MTAVETIIKCLEDNRYFIGNDLFEAINKAKEIEKQQIKEAYNKGFNQDYYDPDFDNDED
jgi:hypothetical protein